MTTISILIPHYNDPNGLALTLRSIEAQTWRGSRKVVVCDDGSKPENVERLQDVVANTSEDVELILNEKNRGRPYTRNVLLDAAMGKYTTWCDSGDEYYPEKIAMQLQGLYRAKLYKYAESVWCTCNSHWQWVSGQKKKVVVQHVRGDQVSNLFLGSIRGYLYTLLGETAAFKSVGYFDLNLPRLQDLDFFLRFVSKGGLLVMPPTHEALCIYHKTDSGRHAKEVMRCSNYIFDKHALLLMGRSRRFRRNRQSQQYRLAARFASNNGDRATTAQFLARSALINPFGFAKWLIKSKGQL